MTGIFEPDTEILEKFNDEKSVKLFRKLLLVESERQNIPKTTIHISTSTNLPDGGIDASITASKIQKTGLLVKGNTGFQIKSGTSFKPWNKGSIKKEIYGGKQASKKNLKPGIKQCLQKGQYVIITFGHHIDDKRYKNSIKILKKHLAVCGIKNPKIDILGSNNIADVLQSYPALVLESRGIDNPSFRTHKSWSRDKDMSYDLVKTNDYDEKIKEIQKILNDKNSARHIRTIAESGIGKTRFICEATRADKFESLVIYTKANDPKLLECVGYILSNEEIHVILVVDDCNQQQQGQLWNMLARRGKRIKLITIYNETSEPKDGDDVTYPKQPKLSDKEIEKILESSSYKIPTDKAKTYATYAGWYPRFAHMIGVNLKNNTDDISKSVNGIYDILFTGNNSRSDEIVKKRRKILRLLSLFKRFGYRDDFEEEAKTIFQLVKKVCPEITWNQFKDIIKWFEDSHILQGDKTLYISVPILQVAMWKEWWEEYSKDIPLESIFEKIPAFSQLRGWFYDMCKYAATSNKATAIVKSLLGSKGPFQKIKLLEIPGGDRFFLALSDSMPKESLNCLENVIGKKSIKKLKEFTIGRREAIYALEKSATHEELFIRSAKLLLRLAEAENETWSNNATGVFQELFSLGAGRVAPTSASPKKRLPVLQYAFNNKSKVKQNLAIKACNTALQTRHFSRMVGAEYQGLQEVTLWSPTSREELICAYNDVLDLLMKNLKKTGITEQTLIVKTVCQNARELIIIPEFTKKIISIFEKIPKSLENQELVLESINHIIQFESENLNQSIIKMLKKLEIKIIGTDYSSLMKRYVALNSRIDLFKNGKNYDEFRKKEIKKLVKISLQKNNLKAELKWLITKEAQNGYQFGYELSKADKNHRCLPMILEAHKKIKKNSDTAFIGGYFRAIFDTDVRIWESFIEKLAEDKILKKIVIEIVIRSGLSDKVGLIILELAKKSTFPLFYFDNFKYGGVRGLSEDLFLKWIEFLISKNDKKIIFTILDLFSMYFIHREDKKIPENTTYKILTDRRILHKSPEVTFGTMDEYNWSEIAKEFIKQHKTKSLELAREMISNFNSDFLGHYNSDAQKVLDQISKENPNGLWKIVSENISIPMDERTFQIRGWLRKSLFLTNVSFLEIKRWIKQDEKNRAWFIAYSSPSILNNDENNLIRKLLITFGKRKDVQRNLVSNLDTEVIMGHASIHYSNKIQMLEKLKSKENHSRIIDWIDWYISLLKKDINREKSKEEREF